MKKPVALSIAVIAMGLAGCTATQQAREVQATAFLGKEASQLKPGAEGEPLLIFRSETADWTAYRKIKLDPVTIWAGEESAFEDFSSMDQQALADTFFSAVHQELSEDYELGEDVLHVQVALTDAQKSFAFLDTISTIHPTTLVLSQAKGLATGKPAFVGEASVEARFLDGESGVLLAADRRVGSKSIENAINSWDDVQASFDYWASQLRYQLCLGRGEADCELPKA